MIDGDAPRVLLACSGLDHARRGFESFARECFTELRTVPDLSIELVKGSGSRGPMERPVPALRRDHRLVRGLARILRARPFRIEALAFALSLQPLIRSRRPDVIYLSEWDTAQGLAWVRARTRQGFRLLLCNGGFAATGFDHLDRVQELTPGARDYVLARGADPARHTLLPLGLRIEPRQPGPDAAERRSLRARLKLPTEARIVISVAALNRRHKRIDYLIDEVAALPSPRPFLLLIGEPDEETPKLRRLARDRLGERGHDIRTVPPGQVPDLLRAGDVFVLASLVEAQGRAMIEAMAHGVPCVAHDSEVSRFALGGHGFVGDLTRPGGLARLLQAVAAETAERSEARREAGHRHVYERFSWERLRPRYVELLTGVARQPALAAPAHRRPDRRPDRRLT